MTKIYFGKKQNIPPPKKEGGGGEKRMESKHIMKYKTLLIHLINNISTLHEKECILELCSSLYNVVYQNVNECNDSCLAVHFNCFYIRIKHDQKEVRYILLTLFAVK